MSRRKTLLDFFPKSPAVKPVIEKNPVLAKQVHNGSKSSDVEKKSFTTPISSFVPHETGKKDKRPASPDNDPESASETEKVKTPHSISSNKKRRRIVTEAVPDDSDEYKLESHKSDADSEFEDCISETKSLKQKKERKIKSTPKSSTSKVKTPHSKPSNKNRRRIVTEADSDDSDEYKPESYKSDTDSEFEDNISDTKSVKQKKESKMVSTPKSSTSKSNFKEKTLNENTVQANIVKEWTHEKFDWLKDSVIRDKSGKLKSDPNYNPQTLFVPDFFEKSLSPGMKQWWSLKSEHFDTILFFKVGKFYELYHMDALTGAKELGLLLMKGEFAHCGFPEIGFGRYSEALVEKGYKVARIEQTETPQMMAERCKKMLHPSKFARVVTREICQITTKGTRTLTYQDETLGTCNNFLMAICEKQQNNESCSEYGICLVDTSIGQFTLGQFIGDRHGSHLLTMIALYPPVEILFEKSSISKKTLNLLNNNLSNVKKEALHSNTQFWDSAKTLQYMAECGFFKSTDDSIVYPSVIMNMLDPDDRLLQTPFKQYELAIRSLGACIWYLKNCCIEDCILSMKLFTEYVPKDKDQVPSMKSDRDLKKHMVLDGITLHNLEIVPVQPSDSSEGTLLGTIDYCSTSFGKRLLRNWLCSPSCNPATICERLDAVDDLFEIPDIVSSTVAYLKKLPDLERLLSKIHAFGLIRSQSHPETRAVFYESDIYNKRKIADFLSTLQGFKTAIKMVDELAPYIKNFKSNLLKKYTTIENDTTECFPNISSLLKYFDTAFDHESAKKEGNVIPTPGVDSQYDLAVKNIDETKEQLQSYLEKQIKRFSCKAKYVTSGKNRYLLEIPEGKKVSDDFEFIGGRKGFRKYYTTETKQLVQSLSEYEESRNAVLKDTSRKIFAEFDKNYGVLKTAVNCVAVLDVIISFVLYRQSSGVTMCRPEFSLPLNGDEPHLEIIDGKHPTFLKYFTGDDYIPNSVYIGSKQTTQNENINHGGKLVLVTGPNMGGKSTLMRQAGTIVILAHLGSYVPAESMSLSPVDRIFTRVGASDQISKGESTFFVEASETSSILHHATSDSFVLVDELGRGTSTFDGTAIAYAVLKYLANDIGCRTLFSTHFHSLVEDFVNHPSVGIGHMACMVGSDIDCPALEKITFLYKFVNGACPKSYGFNVALLAGVLKNIVEQGFNKAQQLENSTRISRSLRKLLSVKTPEEILRAIKNFV